MKRYHCESQYENGVSVANIIASSDQDAINIAGTLDRPGDVSEINLDSMDCPTDGRAA